VLNAIFAARVVSAVVTAALTGTMPAVNQALIDSARLAVDIALGLIGTMALWLGFMRVLRDAGVMTSVARRLAPVMRRLFPDVPAEHPAMSAMILNMSANMLGLGNAATPFGLKAMQELQKLNPRPEVATDSMALFLAINTSGVAVMPLGVIAVRASLESSNAGGIFIPTILATLCSTITGVLVAKLLAKRRAFAAEGQLADAAGHDEPVAATETSFAPIQPEAADSQPSGPATDPAADMPEPPTPARLSGPRLAIAALFGGLILWGLLRQLDSGETGGFREILNSWMLPLLAVAIVLYGFSARVKVYESVVEGAREGFQIVVMIIPFLVAILVAVGVFRASGALDAVLTLVAPVTSAIGFPAEALPMALIRPLSASGALGVMTETMQVHGPDSFVGYLVSVLSGSTETTFYVLAVYFGSIRIRVTRHTVWACLSADLAGALAALFWCRIFF
jgi:spore maturation protein SpmA